MSGFSLHLTRGHLLFLSLFVILSGFFSYLFYRRRPSGAIGRDWPLAFLRGAGLSLLLFALFEPVAGMVLSLRQKPLVPVLIDASGSMSIDDTPPSRLQAAERLIEVELLPSLRKKAEAVVLSFSGHVQAVSESLVPSGKVTDIGESIREVPKVLGRQPSALILVTDGASNVGENPLGAATEAGFPIYTVGVGEASMRRDVLVRMIRTNEIAYTGDRVPVEADIESKGFKDEKTVVSIYEGKKRLDAKEITLSGQKQEQSVTFDLNPKTPGLHTYRIVVAPLNDELTTDNNSRPFAMRVLKSKIKVLLIARPCWDAKFLLISSSEDKNVSMNQLLLLDKTRYLLLSGSSENPGRLPSSHSELSMYDIVAVHSPDRGQISEGLGKLISNFVSSDGKGVLFLGGMSNLPKNLEPLLPVVLGGQLNKQVKHQPTVEGLAHATTSLSAEMYQSQSIWKGLPPVQVEDRAVGLKSGATALAVDPATKTAQGPMPTIAIERFGRGKTMCILSNETWKWSFMPVGLGKPSAAYSNFFSNVFRWLVARQEMDRLRIRTDKNIYTSGETVTFLVEVYDENYRPEDRANVRVKISTKEPIELPLAGMGRGRYEGAVDALPPGQFTYRAVAYKDKEKIAEARGKLAIDELTLEFTETRMREDELKAIASASGGLYFSLSEANLLPDKLTLEAVSAKKRLEFDLKTSPILFILAVAIFGTEWFWRKRRGLP